MAGMTKLLEQAIAKVRQLSAEDQDAFALALLSMAGGERPIMQLNKDTRAAVRDGLAQAKRGEFVPQEEMEVFFKQHGLSARYAIATASCRRARNVRKTRDML